MSGSTRESMGLEPLAISDATSMAAVGLTGRQFRRWLVEAGIPHRKVGRRTVALVENVRRALGAAESNMGSSRSAALSEVQIIELASRRGAR